MIVCILYIVRKWYNVLSITHKKCLKEAYMNSTLVVYESRYGFTEKAARDLALILGPARCIRAGEPMEENEAYKQVVICFPVYMEEPPKELTEWVDSHKDFLRSRRVALLCCALAESRLEQYGEPIRSILGDSVCYSGFIGARLQVKGLGSKDYMAMERFCNKAHMPFKDVDMSDYDRLMDMGVELRRLFEKDGNAMDGADLKEQVELFLKEHNTCVLATACQSSVRATPIEYNYMDGCIYMLSEGGEKFANLLRNPKVSVGIYNSYAGLGSIGGMQITGEAQLLEAGCTEYIKLLEQKGLTMHKLSALPAALNLIKIVPCKIELLDSRVAKKGYNVKQIMEF